MTTDVDSFPSITFPATFEGAAGLGADFSATLKLKTSDGPAVLRDLHALPRGTYDVTIVARQAALAGDSTDREWANMELVSSGDGELVYEAHCLGSRCPVFACHSSGDLEGKYVCEDGAETETYMEVVYGETRCPRYGVEESEDAALDTLSGTELIGEYRALRDRFAASDDQPTPEDGARFDALVDELERRWPKYSEAKLDEVLRSEAGETEEAATGPVVFVLYPDADDEVETQVGQYTTYGELIADYLSAAAIDAEISAFMVLDSEDGDLCPPNAQIAPEAHGRRYAVLPKVEEPAA